MSSTPLSTTKVGLIALATCSFAWGDTLCLDNGGSGWALDQDGAPETQTITVNFPDSSDIVGDVSVYLDVTHSYVGELSIQLESPSGTLLSLMNQPGSDGAWPAAWGYTSCTDNDMEVTFRDGSTDGPLDTAFSDCANNFLTTEATPAFVGNYLPITSLSSLLDEPVSGDWIVTVTDQNEQIGEGGVINEVCLNIQSPAPNLYQSSISVQDLNGGSVEVNDVLQFDIVLVNTGNLDAVINISGDVTSHLNSFTVTETSGGTNNSDPYGGANGNGFLDLTDIPLIAGATTSPAISFTAKVNSLAPDGTDIQQVVDVSANSHDDFSIYSRTITISEVYSDTPTDITTKSIYLSTSSDLSRLQPSTLSEVEIAASASHIWELTPATQGVLTLLNENIELSLIAQKGSGANVDLIVELLASTPSSGDFTIGSGNLTVTSRDAYQVISGQISSSLATSRTLPPGSTFNLKVTNDETFFFRSATLANLNGSDLAFIKIPIDQGITVKSLSFWDDSYPNGTEKNYFLLDNTAYIRALISDPFGPTDIGNATLSLSDALGTAIYTDVAMTEVASCIECSADEKLYEFSFTVPSGYEYGSWEVSVSTIDGLPDENGDTDQRINYVEVGETSVSTDISISKSVDQSVVANNDGFSPIAQFQILAQNLGPSDATNVIVNDLLPAGINYFAHSANLGSYSDSNGNWEIPSLPAGNTAVLYIDITGDTGNYTNTAELISLDQEEATGDTNDTASVDIEVIGAAKLIISRTVSQTTADPGDTVIHTITIENVGVNPADIIQIQESVSPFSEIILDPNTSGTLDGTAAISCDTGCSSGIFEPETPVFSDSFSANDPFNYLPSDQGNGVDGNVRFWQLPMNGQLAAGSNFQLQYQVKVK